MPKVTAQGKTFECVPGANLRNVLLENGVELYNDKAKQMNCRGIGTCGTCAVKIDGQVSEASWREKARLALPPHSPAKNLRLACQTKVLGDVSVTKYDGMWGQGDRAVWMSES